MIRIVDWRINTVQYMIPINAFFKNRLAERTDHKYSFGLNYPGKIIMMQRYTPGCLGKKVRKLSTGYDQPLKIILQIFPFSESVMYNDPSGPCANPIGLYFA